MKSIRFSFAPVLALFTLFAPLPGNSAETGVIDISKPVSKSIAPTGVYWDFDGGVVGGSSPDAVRDPSDQGIEGRILPKSGDNAPAYVEGRFGTAIHLKGKASQTEERNPRVHWVSGDSGNEARLDMAGTSFTAGAWVRLTENFEGDDLRMILFERGESTGNQSYYNFVLQKNQSGAWALVLGIGGEEPANVSSSERTDALNDKQWHHVAASFRRTPDASFVSFWLDGQPLGAERRTTAGVAEVSNPRERQFCVGERNVGYFYGFNGMIDDLFITAGEHGFANGGN